MSRALFSMGATNGLWTAGAAIVIGGSRRTSDSLGSAWSVTPGGDAAGVLGALAAGNGRSTSGRLSSYVRAAADPAAASHTATVRARMRFLGIAMTLLLPRKDAMLLHGDGQAPHGFVRPTAKT
jgi:hypothetical protein